MPIVVAQTTRSLRAVGSCFQFDLHCSVIKRDLTSYVSQFGPIVCVSDIMNLEPSISHLLATRSHLSRRKTQIPSPPLSRVRSFFEFDSSLADVESQIDR